MSTRDFTERDIHLALDGELPDDERQPYEAWLAGNPVMQARAARFADDMDRLCRQVAPVVGEPVPERLAATVGDGRAAPPPRAAAAWRLAALAAVLLAGIALGYLAGASGWMSVEPQAVRLADGAIAAHNIYSAEKLHVVEVGADQKDHLVGWLSKRLGMNLVAPDLGAQGYALLGGRLLPAGDENAAQFMYEDGAGNRISLYIARNTGTRDTGFRFAREGATRAVFWLEPGYGCAIAGSASDAALTGLADSAYRQILGGKS
ncbi:MAG: anti-sigma factor [Rhizobiaceae bacterium]|nr:anti-sigma factor [Rhizobiaceae bacterium]